MEICENMKKLRSYLDEKKLNGLIIRVIWIVWNIICLSVAPGYGLEKERSVL